MKRRLYVLLAALRFLMFAAFFIKTIYSFDNCVSTVTENLVLLPNALYLHIWEYILM